MSEPRMKDVTGHVVFNLEVAEDFYLMRLGVPHIAAEVVPGQFVEVRVSSQFSPFLRIPLSICNTDSDAGTVDILYEDMGPKSRALSLQQPGNEVACLGPLGHGFKAPAADLDAVLVGGGIGTPPLLFLGEKLRYAGRQVCLLVGARSSGKHLPDTLLSAAARDVQKATDDGSVGHHGLVTDLLKKKLDEVEACTVYTCGPHAMMAAVAAICRESQIPCQASLEEYMACGFGVCVGCVIEVTPPESETVVSPYMQYSRICVDGPVFDAHRVCW
jgi:dihydroorotate dehydrogenase electron transfer subunit